ncbi:MAG: ABC transporter substrate-binding protein [Betaproteobacteria bacterium]
MFLTTLLPFSPAAFSAEAPMRIVVSVPGPRNLSYLPIDLISKIGADRAEGAEIQLLNTGGGAVALQNLSSRNCDFAVAGVPAAMSQQASGGKVAVIAAVDDAPLFILMVRSDLRNKVKRVADLKGRVVGVNTSSLSSKTTSQQLAELVLRADGVSPDEVRIVPAGQSWVEQSSLLISGTVDAIMGDEPFASRLLEEKQVFFLMNLSDPAIARRIPGANFLHAAVETRRDLLANEPAKAEKMVRMLRRTLQWMAGHTPQEIVEKLGVQDREEKDSLLKTLRKYKNMYSRDGRFSTRQLQETDIFFHKASEGDPVALSLKLESMVVDKWAGRKE